MRRRPNGGGAGVVKASIAAVTTLVVAERLCLSAQVATGCWDDVPTNACALCNQPLCVQCGFKRCCHRVIANESGPSVTDVIQVTSGGRVQYTVPVVYALCDLRLRVCVGTQCVDTGVVYAMYCGSRAASGDACP